MYVPLSSCILVLRLFLPLPVIRHCCSFLLCLPLYYLICICVCPWCKQTQYHKFQHVPDVWVLVNTCSMSNGSVISLTMLTSIPRLTNFIGNFIMSFSLCKTLMVDLSWFSNFVRESGNNLLLLNFPNVCLKINFTSGISPSPILVTNQIQGFSLSSFWNPGWQSRVKPNNWDLFFLILRSQTSPNVMYGSAICMWILRFV